MTEQRSGGSNGLKIGGVAFAVAAAIGAPTTMYFEGGPVLVAYADPVGIPTDCVGHTGPEVRIGQVSTLEQCMAKFTVDQRREAVGLSRCITGTLKPHEAAAILSWAFNVGSGAACSSTLIRMVNAGAPGSEFCPQFDRWVYATKAGVRVKLNGLVRRRAAERAMCEGRP